MTKAAFAGVQTPTNTKTETNDLNQLGFIEFAPSCWKEKTGPSLGQNQYNRNDKPFNDYVFRPADLLKKVLYLTGMIAIGVANLL